MGLGLGFRLGLELGLGFGLGLGRVSCLPRVCARSFGESTAAAAKET